MLFVLSACNLSADAENEQSPHIPAADRWTKDRVFLSPLRAASGSAAGLLPDETKSILRIEETLKYGEFVWNDKNIGPGKLLVRVDLRTQLISVFRGKHEIGTAVILFGAKGNDTPIGTFPVKAKSRDHHSRTYDAPMPFSLWLTDDGVAVHGSEVRWGAGTHGCVGVPLEFASKLFKQAKVGDIIEILRSPRPEVSPTG